MVGNIHMSAMYTKKSFFYKWYEGRNGKNEKKILVGEGAKKPKQKEGKGRGTMLRMFEVAIRNHFTFVYLKLYTIHVRLCIYLYIYKWTDNPQSHRPNSHEKPPFEFSGNYIVLPKQYRTLLFLSLVVSQGHSWRLALIALGGAMHTLRRE